MTSPASTNRPETAKILIIDDDRNLVDGLRRQLWKHGYSAVFCEDAAFAMTSVRREEPDLIILDIGLPAGGGTAVLTRLRSTEEFRSIPVLVLTGGSEDMRAELFEVGADAFLTKPAEFDEINRTIKTLIEGRA
jgi:DNA-binding response OmpR family regulator